MRINTVTTAISNGAEVSHIETELLSTNSASVTATRTFDNGVQVGNTLGIAYANGFVFTPIASALVRTELKNGSAALVRLNKTGALTAKMTQAAAGSEFVSYSPDEILGGTQIDPLRWLNENTDGPDLASVTGLSFSEVSSAQDVNNLQLTDYSFTATIPASNVLPAKSIDFVVRYNNHIFRDETIAMTVGGVVVSSTTTLETVSQLSLPTTWQDNAVEWTTLVSTGKRISAEKLVTPTASAIAAKATATAKKAKKAIVASYIAAAAKSLKYSVTAIKNGVKVSTKYQSQTGSMCVTALRGKASVAHC